jgi:glutathione synthase
MASAAQLSRPWPPKRTAALDAFLTSSVQEWCLANGLVFVAPSESTASGSATTSAAAAPVTLLPTPFPASCFKAAQEIQETYNELYAAVAADESWLERTLQEYASLDIAPTIMLL